MRLDRQIPNEIRSAHQELSEAAAELLRMLDDDGARRRLDASCRQVAEECSGLYPYPVQPWPLLLGSEKRNRIAQATVSLSQLVRSIPERVFDSDPAAIAAFYHIPSPWVAALWLEKPSGLDSALVRCDLLEADDGSILCAEINGSAYLGGAEMGDCAAALLTNPSLREMLDRLGVSAAYHDPFDTFFDHLIADLKRRGIDPGDELHVAVVLAPDAGSLRHPVVRLLGDAFRRARERAAAAFGGTLDFCLYSQNLEERDGCPRIGERRIHAVVEFTYQATPAWLYRAFKAGEICLYNGPAKTLLGDKRNLALLSESQGSAAWSAEERQLIEAHVPWSRILRLGTTTGLDGEQVDLVEHILGRRRDLVIKPARAARGDGVEVGPFVAEDTWRRAVAAAFASGQDWIVQRYVRPRPYAFEQDGDWARHDLTWGIFCCGDRFANGFVRMMPSGQGDGIVNTARGARETVILEV